MKKTDPMTTALMEALKLPLAQAIKEAVAEQMESLRVGLEQGNEVTVIRRKKAAGPKKAIDPKWAKVMKECPQCPPGTKAKPVDPDFGITKDRYGKPRPQPWCRKCRNAANYHGVAPKYKTRNNPSP